MSLGSIYVPREYIPPKGGTTETAAELLSPSEFMNSAGGKIYRPRAIKDLQICKNCILCKHLQHKIPAAEFDTKCAPAGNECDSRGRSPLWLRDLPFRFLFRGIAAPKTFADLGVDATVYHVIFVLCMHPRSMYISSLSKYAASCKQVQLKRTTKTNASHIQTIQHSYGHKPLYVPGTHRALSFTGAPFVALDRAIVLPPSGVPNGPPSRR